MTKNICLACGGSCCSWFSLHHEVDGERVYNDDFCKKWIKDNMPHMHYNEEEGYFSCDWHVGKCSNYEERPEFCREFYCSEYHEIETAALYLGLA